MAFEIQERERREERLLFLSGCAHRLGDVPWQLVNVSASRRSGRSAASRALGMYVLRIPSRIDDVVFAQGYGNGGALRRPLVGAGRRPADHYAGLPARPPLRLRPAGGDQRRHDGAERARRMSSSPAASEHEQCRILHHRHAQGARGPHQCTTASPAAACERSRSRRFGVISGMIETAENLARDYRISREPATPMPCAPTSAPRPPGRTASSRTNSSKSPCRRRRANRKSSEHDEGYRPDATVESLGAIRAIQKSGMVTAGNASQQNDAASACLVVGRGQARRTQPRSDGLVRQLGRPGCDPASMASARAGRGAYFRAPASVGRHRPRRTQRSLRAAGSGRAQGLGLEHSATQLNVNGSGISFGHPIGATGGRILANLMHELKRTKGKYGLETMCIGAARA